MRGEIFVENIKVNLFPNYVLDKVFNGAGEYRELVYVEADEAAVKLQTRLEKRSSKLTLSNKLVQPKEARDKRLITAKEYEE